MAALEAAAQSNRYVLIFFWRQDDPQTRSMSGVFEAAAKDLAATADTATVRISDAHEASLVQRFGVARAPMPLVLAVAPNGAVTKGFPVSFTQEQLSQALVSPATATCLKALQDKRLVLLCVQDQRTGDGQAALRAARAFQADARFAGATEMVTINPSDPAEAPFLKTLHIDPHVGKAVTVILAPPGRAIAHFTGAVTKEQLVAKVTAAQSSCCPGGQCGPNGCSPGGQCGTR